MVFGRFLCHVSRMRLMLIDHQNKLPYFRYDGGRSVENIQLRGGDGESGIHKRCALPGYVCFLRACRTCRNNFSRIAGEDIICMLFLLTSIWVIKDIFALLHSHFKLHIVQIVVRPYRDRHYMAR